MSKQSIVEEEILRTVAKISKISIVLKQPSDGIDIIS